MATGETIVGEEFDDDRGGNNVGWIVDPIDGTVNFLYDLPAPSPTSTVQKRSARPWVQVPDARATRSPQARPSSADWPHPTADSAASNGLSSRRSRPRHSANNDDSSGSASSANRLAATTASQRRSSSAGARTTSLIAETYDS